MRQRKSKALTIMAGLLTIALASSGCSVVKGLASAGNMDIIYLSTAATTVLLEDNYKIQRKPVCKLEDREQQEYACTGSTLDGKAINVSVADGEAADPIMVITVDDKQVFKGSVEAVIQANAQISPSPEESP